jgi:hypothetical protein
MRRGRTSQLTDGILGQHIALSVAAGLARTQLSPDPLRVHDAQHLGEMLDIIARALAKVAPLYVRESPDADPRALTPEELEDAAIKRGAAAVVLKSGRSFSAVTMRRGDLRQAVAVLKTLGIPELSPPRAVQEPAPRPSPDPAHALLDVLDEVEALLQPPLVASQLERANAAALAIARRAPQGPISNLAMQLMSCMHEARGANAVPEKCRLILARLRQALDEMAAKT